MTKHESHDENAPNPHIWDAQSSIPGLKINRHRTKDGSAHRVMSGTHPSFGSVMIKPHAKGQKAMREALALEHVGLHGIPTPNFVALNKGKLAHYLLTEEYPGLTTLTEAHDLRVGIADPRLRRSITPAIISAARGLGAIHGIGASHGDFQAKNAALGPGGEFVAMDLENARIDVAGKKGVDSRQTDLYTFGASMLLDGLLEGRSARYRTQYLDDTVLAQHMDIAGRIPGAEVDYDLIANAFLSTATEGRKTGLPTTPA